MEYIRIHMVFRITFCLCCKRCVKRAKIIVLLCFVTSVWVISASFAYSIACYGYVCV